MTTKTDKPRVGKLILIHPHPAVRDCVLASGKSFAQLQQLKKEYMMQGYKFENLKITY